MVDRLALLNLAFTKTDNPAEALKLAKEMEAWIADKKPAEAPPPAVKEVPVKRRRAWRSNDIKTLIAMRAAGASTEEMCEKLNRSRSSIHCAAHKIMKGEMLGRSVKPAKRQRGRPRKEVTLSPVAKAKDDQTSPPGLATVQEAAPSVAPDLVPLHRAPALFNLSRSGIYRLAAEKRIRLVKNHSRTLVDANSVRAFLASLPEAQIGEKK